ncbi:Pimeloyl-ACP methyl ester carboxylesterase [Salinihabitans flavidus]|uniref:Pimeloyl-ACP methyl ester carboxylesterase n=1 Tax=Salinihabitans flavidus TaxID=569882 RepID=A0A1H8U5V8_9RHOB|nr:alpha/beta fold hydrolase [Salinihabitans flavidus]SEO98672.1 Pimeloyl-ACP methyl ester carboxylesterase [Salinihabitans flavidus]
MTDWQTHNASGIEYLERPGSGPVLVLLHGIGSQAASFTPLLAHLPADWRMIAWNAPGYGASGPLAQDWPQAADYARALTGLLDTLGVNRILLAGHSLGALVAASFASTHGGRVARLLLASPALGHGVTPGLALSTAAQTRIDELTQMGADAFARARAARLVHDPDTHPDVVEMVRRAMAQVSLPGYAQAARMLASGRLLDDAERLVVPTDVIVGEEDRVTPPEGAGHAHAALRDAARGRLIRVPGAGHALYQQAPAAFAEALAALVEPAR